MKKLTETENLMLAYRAINERMRMNGKVAGSVRKILRDLERECKHQQPVEVSQ